MRKTFSDRTVKTPGSLSMVLHPDMSNEDACELLSPLPRTALAMERSDKSRSEAMEVSLQNFKGFDKKRMCSVMVTRLSRAVLLCKQASASQLESEQSKDKRMPKFKDDLLEVHADANVIHAQFAATLLLCAIILFANVRPVCAVPVRPEQWEALDQTSRRCTHMWSH
jgi:hypothetical protein